VAEAEAEAAAGSEEAVSGGSEAAATAAAEAKEEAVSAAVAAMAAAETAETGSEAEAEAEAEAQAEAGHQVLRLEQPPPAHPAAQATAAVAAEAAAWAMQPRPREDPPEAASEEDAAMPRHGTLQSQPRPRCRRCGAAAAAAPPSRWRTSPTTPVRAAACGRRLRGGVDVALALRATLRRAPPRTRAGRACFAVRAQLWRATFAGRTAFVRPNALSCRDRYRQTTHQRLRDIYCIPSRCLVALPRDPSRCPAS
jgi:hypothetical protein